MKAEDLKSRLLGGYFLFGICNLIVVSTFIYFEVRSTLIERSMAHMTSVAGLAKQKLKLFLDATRDRAREEHPSLFEHEMVASVCRQVRGKLIPLRGASCTGSSMKDLPYDSFFPEPANSFLLKTRSAAGDLLWRFNHLGLTGILNQRMGLGESGEIYLVGPDRLVKSASRFIEDWTKIRVSNESVNQGLEGKVGVSSVRDYRGVEVVSAHAPLRIDRLNFAILAEIDRDEVLAPLHESLLKLLTLGLILVLANVLLALLLAKGTLEKVKEMRGKIIELTRRIIHVQEEERERMAYDLHDNIGQHLTALKWGLSHLGLELKGQPKAAKVKDLEELSETIIQEVRSLSRDILPSLIKDFGPVRAINEYLSQQGRLQDLIIDFRADPGLEELEAPREFQINLYRMVQELLQNALKHSLATKLNFELRLENRRLVMIYSDDGKGLEEGSPLPRSLAYRAQLYSGHLESLMPEKGMKLRITFELEEVLP